MTEVRKSRPYLRVLWLLAGMILAVALMYAGVWAYSWKQQNDYAVEASAAEPAPVPTEGAEAVATGVAAAAPAPDLVDAVFIGDPGWYRKGKLLDASARAEWAALPDRLAPIEYEDRIRCVECADNPLRTESTFSPLAQDNASSLADYRTSYGKTRPALVRYLALALAGKVGFPHIEGASTETVVSHEVFRERYAPVFNHVLFKRAGASVKRTLLAWLDRQEGSWAFAMEGNLDPGQLMNLSDFNQDGVEDLAVLLRESNDDTHRLLVIATKQGATDGYVLHDQPLDGRALLQSLYPDPEERWERDIYMGGDEKVSPKFDPLLVTPAEGTPFALVYDPKFDVLRSYPQRPASEEQVGPDEGDEGA